MGSLDIPASALSSALPESSCSYLLQELKLIWNEVGQEQSERERVLHELEQECLEVYKRKVDCANIARVRLHQTLADAEAELTNLLISLGERSFPGRTEIQKIYSEIVGRSEECVAATVNENDLSVKKLEEFHSELQRLNREKSNRLMRVQKYVREIDELAATMGMESAKIITGVHPSLDGSRDERSRSISDAILEMLDYTVKQLKDEKKKRMDKLCKLGKALTNLWNLMDAPVEDRQPFIKMGIFSSSFSEDNACHGSLTLDIIDQVELEVARLDQLKASKMKELFCRKTEELEGICKKSHMELPQQPFMDNILKLIMSGEIEHADLITTMEERISRAHEEASSRKDIMEKVERWIMSCNEERWLEDFSRDENRYSVSKGIHKNLQRAERARITVNRIPALVEMIIAKTKIWEEEREKNFLYDEVPLMAMLEEYKLLRREKEEEKHRQREKKKVQTTAEKTDPLRSRPGTSTSRIPNRNMNNSFISTSPLSRRVSGHKDQLGSNSSATHFARSKKESNRMQTCEVHHLPDPYGIQRNCHPV
ncbi:hypothetical protein HPP92_024968 [Vanilla planifolia]|uniref:65-kDa microtubule-associated protein 8 n=1 Tax=Vanilla planifolia TaxID=51239 RepID=A0A835PI72_VANPL|nr:hypothetical protein HPP92_024968 [Vanilla planifolia]